MKTEEKSKKDPITEEQMAQGLNVDENMAGTELLNDELGDEDEASALRAELEEAKDKYVRLVAEFDNARKRSAREYREMMQLAGREIIQSLLDVVDDSDRAMKQLESSDDIAAAKEGVQLVFQKLKNILQQKGLKAMESEGVDFDPELHEAITEIQVEGKEGKVVDVVQPGYYLNDKLIRHAKVVVGK